MFLFCIRLQSVQVCTSNGSQISNQVLEPKSQTPKPLCTKGRVYSMHIYVCSKDTEIADEIVNSTRIDD